MNKFFSLLAEWLLPSGSNSMPYGMARDEQDRIWLVETGSHPNQLVGFDTRSEKVISITQIPSGAGSVRHMDYHQESGTIWFGTDSSTIGRASIR